MVIGQAWTAMVKLHGAQLVRGKPYPATSRMMQTTLHRTKQTTTNASRLLASQQQCCNGGHLCGDFVDTVTLRKPSLLNTMAFVLLRTWQMLLLLCCHHEGRSGQQKCLQAAAAAPGAEQAAGMPWEVHPGFYGSETGAGILP